MYEKSPVRGGLCVAKARSPVTARSGGGGVNDLEHEEVCEVACYRGVFSVALDDFLLLLLYRGRRRPIASPVYVCESVRPNCKWGVAL